MLTTRQFPLIDWAILKLSRFSTGFGVTGGSALIHEFYSREVTNPVHLTVDTGFTNGEASIKAFVSVNLSLGDQQLAAQFQEIPLDLRMVEAERVGCMCWDSIFSVNSFYSQWYTGHMVFICAFIW